MIKIYCDCCKKEIDNSDFMFEADHWELRTSLVGKEMTPQTKMEKEKIQICKGCFYKHISQLLNEKK